MRKDSDTRSRPVRHTSTDPATHTLKEQHTRCHTKTHTGHTLKKKNTHRNTETKTTPNSKLKNSCVT